MKVKVGDSLFACMGVRGRFTGVKEYKVLSVRVKYFYVEELKERFAIDNLLHSEKDYPQWNIQLYTTAKEIEDIQEMNTLSRRIDGFFRFSQDRKLSLQELRDIFNIIYPTK